MSKETSNALKGLGILALLFLHLFYNFDRNATMGVDFGLAGQKVVEGAATIFHAVDLFLFVSAYGLTVQYNKKDICSDGRSISKDFFARYIKLITNLWIIYIPAAIVSLIIQKHSVISIYLENGSKIHAVLYFIIDFLGLAKLFGTPTFHAPWWYLSLAIIMFALLPMINLLYKKFGKIILFFAVLLIVMIEVKGGTMAAQLMRYLFTMVVAVVFANENSLENFSSWLTGLKTNNIVKSIIQIGFAVLFLALWVAAAYLYLHKYIDKLIYNNATGLLMVMLFTVISTWKVMKPVMAALGFLGKYSMNIYFMHGFIFSYFFRNFIYSFKKYWLIYLVLLAITLAISIIIEKIKDITRFGEMQKALVAKIHSI